MFLAHTWKLNNILISNLMVKTLKIRYYMCEHTELCIVADYILNGLLDVLILYSTKFAL